MGRSFGLTLETQSSPHIVLPRQISRTVSKIDGNFSRKSQKFSPLATGYQC